MRIAQVATLSTPVRRRGSGSIEGLVWLLTEELTKLGHEVTVFGAAGSLTAGETIETIDSPYGTGNAPSDWQICEWINLGRAIEESARFDLIHSHSYLHALPLNTVTRAPIVNTLHVNGDVEAARLWRLYPDACVTAISRAQWAAFPDLTPSAVIHHAVDSTQFTFSSTPADYLCYLGRFTAAKGPLEAIEAARALDMRIVLAGPRNDYFRQHVEPLVDGHAVEYAGPVGGERRDRLLGGARALLYPLRKAEPFGLVMIEAMACGTPVAAMRVGAVPELVDEAVTGSLADAPDQYAGAVARALTLDRAVVRARATERFSSPRMAAAYLDVYARLLARRGAVQL